MAVVDILKMAAKYIIDRGIVDKDRESLNIKAAGCCSRSFGTLLLVGFEILEAVLLFATSFHSCYKDGVVGREGSLAAGILTCYT